VVLVAKTAIHFLYFTLLYFTF